ncbi:hypothetical protein FIBSPDRAFT_774015 [Athelia psychrophila]|uniref:F-box domain-containing protein n=1 Tax=Athelia psychrophila TaxID=1759441 RepID=A0A166VLN4_9AGAM|nr:hypothetical protein FIBSPDRAFT_774015 [Fibularhizoctonia sp. CBS 109695]
MNVTQDLVYIPKPTTADVNTVLEAISVQEKAIASLENEIEDIMRNVRRLAHHKAAHHARIKHLKGLITLASRMPTELLATIFEHAASEWSWAPVAVSHVCSSWRAAANLPGVWSHLYVNCDRDPYRRTEFWLAKAQQAPLYITIEVSADASALGPVMDLLAKRAFQWRSLVINALLTHQANYVLSRCGKPTPDLRRVDIQVDLERRDADEIEDQLVGFREAFEDAPRLSTVHLYRELSQTTSFLPGGITRLFLHLPLWSGPATVSAASVVELLEGVPSLEHFTLEFPKQQERAFVPPPEPSLVAHVPHLLSLSLIVSPDVNALLSSIYAPALRRLHLRSSCEPLGYAHPPTGASLANFIELSTPPLEFLEIHDVDIPNGEFRRVLAGLPELLELRLHESEIEDDVIAQLNGAAGFCPRLVKLDLRWCDLLTGRVLVELAHSRMPAQEHACPLQEITVLNCSFVNEHDIMDLARSTRCRVVVRDREDICRSKGCCNNERYRQRLRLRHLLNYSANREQLGQINLIL